MDILNILIIIYQIFFYIVAFLMVYNLLIGFFGIFCSRKQKYKMIPDKQKFCIFVPCHNEADVIGATVENLSKFTYTKDLFDVYFIADNCNDETANEIRKVISQNNLTNINVLERFVNDPSLKGKPHALRWGIEKLQQEKDFYNYYDMLMILDADNFADSNILEHINSQYFSYKKKKRPEVIQTYLDSKNKNTLIARGYYACYRVSNGFFQLPKSRLGLNVAIGGTGFAITTKFLNEMGGYKCSSLTEDLEIQTIATLKGKKIIYNGNVRIYDEKPTKLKQSAVQKTRWAQGHWFIMFKYIGRLFISLFNLKQIKSFFKKIDNMVYLCSFVFYLGILFLPVFNLFFWILGIAPINPILNTIILYLGICGCVILPISSLYDGSKQEKKDIFKDFIPNLIAVQITGLVYMYAALIGLFKCGNQKVWKKTSHKVTTLCNEVNEPVSVQNVETVTEGTLPEVAKIETMPTAIESEVELKKVEIS